MHRWKSIAIEWADYKAWIKEEGMRTCSFLRRWVLDDEKTCATERRGIASGHKEAAAGGDACEEACRYKCNDTGLEKRQHIKI